MVGIVILNYNNVDDTVNCVKSIYNYCNGDLFRICIVDNNSCEEVVNSVQLYLCHIEGYCLVQQGEQTPVKLPRLTYLLNRYNGGYAQGNNCGLSFLKKYKEIDYYLILNNDVLFTMDIIAPLSQYLYRHKEVGVVSPMLYGRDGKVDYECCRYEKSMIDFFVRIFHLERIKVFARIREQNKILKRYPDLIKQDVVESNLPSGSCMMFRKETFEAIDFFDPNTFLYFEEDILWKKLKKMNLKSVLLPAISCIHLGAGSTSKSSLKIIDDAYRESLIYYLKKYSGFPRIFIAMMLLKIRFCI